jgi:hypothetical protein
MTAPRFEENLFPFRYKAKKSKNRFTDGGEAVILKRQPRSALQKNFFLSLSHFC